MALMRGALIEYGSDFMGPIPNIVIFQFNPESLTRAIQIPPRQSSGMSRETSQAGEPSVEKITLTAKFSAADEMGDNKVLARIFGVGTRLAALEKMVHPANTLLAAIGAALTGDSTPAAGDARQVIPREKYPRILFVWGLYRILPVVLESMSINEQQYDFLLNPVQAEVSISMSVNAVDTCSDDSVGKGALTYSNMAKDAQAMANLANTAEQAVELIPF
ncbi:MAG TPA: hypothetical protein VGO50_02875 [Pyrinomonadaceae bacterium]|jgi:hypothetical protein|nr:hypothetical protein [Pyrinomonadaceae bacterium]